MKLWSVQKCPIKVKGSIASLFKDNLISKYHIQTKCVNNLSMQLLQDDRFSWIFANWGSFWNQKCLTKVERDISFHFWSHLISKYHKWAEYINNFAMQPLQSGLEISFSPNFSANFIKCAVTVRKSIAFLRHIRHANIINEQNLTIPFPCSSYIVVYKSLLTYFCKFMILLRNLRVRK